MNRYTVTDDINAFGVRMSDITSIKRYRRLLSFKYPYGIKIMNRYPTLFPSVYLKFKTRKERDQKFFLLMEGMNPR